ncbi:oocyte-secreted protein 2-like, partial [Erinaceus europaeus]|uniref:Oocyte-secreted protein 2-like n=1 Tax=Erinaceus europaeus TaxID=9365 RepID=A0ABM3XKL0_ERIEU
HEYDFIYCASECGIGTQIISEHLYCFASRKSVCISPVSTEDEMKLNSSPFMADFTTTPEELELLSYSQNDTLFMVK